MWPVPAGYPPMKTGNPLRALVGLLFPRRWKSDLAEIRRLLAAEHPAREGLGTRIDRWLTSPGWEVRNAAVKLIAHVRDAERYPCLTEKLLDHTEAGIVRRNAAEALARIGQRDLAVQAALLEAIHDRYWEVRAEAIRALAAIYSPSEDLERPLLGRLYIHSRKGRRRLRERNFEARMAIAEGLGCLGVTRAAFDALADLVGDDRWLVRSQAAVGLAHFAARNRGYLPEARHHVRAVDRLSEGAISYFVHREVLSHVLQGLRKEAAGLQPQELRSLYLSPRAGWNHVRR